MPIYKYRAWDRAGNLQTGHAEAEELQQLKDLFKERGLWITKATKSSDLLAKLSEQQLSSIKPVELLMFTRQMGVMLNSGVQLVTALTQIRASASPTFRQVLTKVIDDIRNGKSYASALAAYPLIFSTFFVGMIEVGEASGLLAEVHRKLTAYIQQNIDLKKKLLFASIYPAFVFAATIGGVVILLVFAFPKITGMYSKYEVELPLITKTMIGLSDFLLHQWYVPLIALGIILVSFLGFRIHRKPPLKNWLDRLVFKIPVYNEFIRQIILAQFAFNLSLLLNSGVTILRALNIIKGLIDNTVIQDNISDMIRSVEEGEGMSNYMQTQKFFPALFVSMVQTGETSGELTKMMDDANAYFSDEVEAGTKKFVAVVEPLLIIFGAGFVFLVLIAFYLPMFQLFKVISAK